MPHNSRKNNGARINPARVIIPNATNLTPANDALRNVIQNQGTPPNPISPAPQALPSIEQGMENRISQPPTNPSPAPVAPPLPPPTPAFSAAPTAPGAPPLQPGFLPPPVNAAAPVLDAIQSANNIQLPFQPQPQAPLPAGPSPFAPQAPLVAPQEAQAQAAAQNAFQGVGNEAAEINRQTQGILGRGQALQGAQQGDLSRLTAQQARDQGFATGGFNDQMRPPAPLVSGVIASTGRGQLTSGIGGGRKDLQVGTDKDGNPISQFELIQRRNLNAGSERLERAQAKKSRNDLLRAASFAEARGDTQSMAALVAQASQVNIPGVGSKQARRELESRGKDDSSPAGLQRLENKGKLDVAKEASRSKQNTAKALGKKDRQARNDALDTEANKRGEMSTQETAEFGSMKTELDDAIKTFDDFRKNVERDSDGKMSDEDKTVLSNLEITVRQSRTRIKTFLGKSREAGAARAAEVRGRKGKKGRGPKVVDITGWSQERIDKLDKGTEVVNEGTRGTIT